MQRAGGTPSIPLSHGFYANINDGCLLWHISCPQSINSEILMIRCMQNHKGLAFLINICPFLVTFFSYWLSMRMPYGATVSVNAFMQSWCYFACVFFAGVCLQREIRVQLWRNQRTKGNANIHKHTYSYIHTQITM